MIKHETCLDVKSRYYLIFHSSVTERCWVHFFLKKGFLHVSVMIWKEDDWYLLDPTWNGLEFCRIEWAYGTDAPLKYFSNNGFSLLEVYKLNFGKKKKFSMLNCFSCVNLVKYMIGLKAKVVTPFGLNRYLMKKGYGRKAI